MKCALVAVSKAGAELAARLESSLPEARSFVFAPHAGEGQEPFENITAVAGKLWHEYRGIVFLCAAGIAVRAIAPHIRSKHEDPAVVVTADNGAYAVSLLSGHEGGANDLAALVAAGIGAVPVITTASEESPRPLPRNLVAGIGCRRGTSPGDLRNALDTVFARRRLSPLRLRSIATIDLKEDEPGLREFAEILGLPVLFYRAGELEVAEGDFSSSPFVKEITGVDNVCERAAVLGAAGGKIIVPKTAMEGITVAVAEKEYVYG